MPEPISPGAALAALRPLRAYTCAECGTGFTARRVARYCSDRCRYRAANARRPERRGRQVKPETFACAECGTAFAAWPRNHVARYCSALCKSRAAWRRRKEPQKYPDSPSLPY